MLAIPSKHRSLTLLAGVVVAQVLLLAVQIRREQEVRLIRVWAVTLVTPLERAGAWAIDKIEGVWINYLDLRNTRRENTQLRRELAELKLQASRLESRAIEADRLAALLNFRDAHSPVPMLAARVIGSSAAGTSKTIYVNRGEEDGVRKNMAVIIPDGVIGKILEAYPRTAQVLLLTDKESGVGAVLAASRTQGVVRGAGEPLALMDYVITDENVPDGEHILTSGQDRIFPKDLPVGTVIETRPGNPFKLIRVKPAARLDRLEEVLILLSRQELDPKREGQNPVQPEEAKPGAAKQTP